MSTARTLNTVKKYFAAANIKSVQHAAPFFLRKYKIVVFVPLKNADELTFIMASRGAGFIGKYSLCSFRTKGAGTFMGSLSSRPAVGKKGEFQIVEEIRLEMICDEADLENVVEAAYSKHPYEEPVCEVYPVMVKNTTPEGSTVFVELKRSVTVGSVLAKLNKKLLPENLPAKVKNLRIRQALIDLVPAAARLQLPASKGSSPRNKTLYIRRENKTINIEII